MMISICSKPIDLSFYFTPYGGVKPVEMAVTHILRDIASGKQFFVFTCKNHGSHYFAREYLGDIKEQRFFNIKSKETLNEILRALQHDGMNIIQMERYIAFDS